MEFAGTSPFHVLALVVAQTNPRVLWFWRSVRCASHHLIIALPTSEWLATLVSAWRYAAASRGRSKTWVVACPFRHDGPGGARHLVGQSHGHKLERLLGQQHPGPVGEP